MPHSCYCGCDTRGNRIKFIISGSLFLVGFVCMFIIFGISSSADCEEPPTGDCQSDLLFNSTGDPERDRQICEAAKAEYERCIDDIAPALLFLYFVQWLSWIGASIPLCMMCCCTQNPHDVTMHGPVVYEMQPHPTGVYAPSVYAPAQPYANPFMQGAQEVAPAPDGAPGVVSKPMGSGMIEDIPMYTAQITPSVPPPRHDAAQRNAKEQPVLDAS